MYTEASKAKPPFSSHLLLMKKKKIIQKQTRVHSKNIHFYNSRSCQVSTLLGVCILLLGNQSLLIICLLC